MRTKSSAFHQPRQEESERVFNATANSEKDANSQEKNAATIE